MSVLEAVVRRPNHIGPATAAAQLPAKRLPVGIA
ncbi:hypothetical protein MKAN_20795 [Mycobacterium kansasii ATCC 12478]|nr:hypothetical protein MKAN_20795 [Mycobacterium kansasii ATCC 12478]